MTETRMQEVREFGQSIWLDFIRRSFMDDGGLDEYINQGLCGVTSNPSIFDKAISEGAEYDQDIADLASQGKTTQEIYETLVVQDIQQACDILMSVYEQTNGKDGYVSLEVSPHLAHDTKGTIQEVKKYWDLVNRENLMVKVPATPEGIPAIKELTAGGYNINVTLMFSLQQYDLVSEAYISGVEKFITDGGNPENLHSVASFFVSRLDVKLDRIFQAIDDPVADQLMGKIGIANAKMAYQRYLEKFSTQRWEELRQEGGNEQRVLYGSTSTKNPDYPDTLYPDNLIGKNTVNTLPPRTIAAFLDHGRVSASLTSDLDQAKEQLRMLSELGINLDNITKELLDEGVVKFANSFDQLMVSIAQKKEKLA